MCVCVCVVCVKEKDRERNVYQIEPGTKGSPYRIGVGNRLLHGVVETVLSDIGIGLVPFLHVGDIGDDDLRPLLAVVVAVDVATVVFGLDGEDSVSRHDHMINLSGATEKAAAAGAVDPMEKTAEKDAQEAAKSELSLSEAYEKHAKNTRSAGRIKAIVTLTQPFCTIEADKLDADPFVLNTPAGLYDLRSGAVRRTARGDLCTHMTKAIPSYNAL